LDCRRKNKGRRRQRGKRRGRGKETPERLYDASFQRIQKGEDRLRVNGEVAWRGISLYSLYFPSQFHKKKNKKSRRRRRRRRELIYLIS
jgi:hypothetical protein